MAITLEANYSKKLGLPGFSSHQYMITLKTELSDLAQVEAESSRLYALLQASVDRELQQPGFVPDLAARNTNSNGHTSQNGVASGSSNGNGHRGNGNGQAHRSNGNGNYNRDRDQWACSPKQRQYILDLVEQHSLDKNWVEQLAQDRFGKPVRQLNKLEASGLIEEIKEQTATNNRSRQQLAA